LTEFLPVSSSGHLVIAQELFPAGISYALAFDVCLHFGTLIAVLLYFRTDLLDMTRALFGRVGPEQEYLRRWVWLLALATLPAVAVGLGFAHRIESAFHSLPAVGLALLVTASLLLFACHRLDGKAGPAEVGFGQALVVGLLQAMALVPGISRSGSTITGGLASGMQPHTAARFAFLLSVPAIAGAMVLNVGSVGDLLAVDAGAVVAGTLSAAITGWLAIAVMMRAVELGRLRPFALYCGVLGCATLLLGWL
jgi:undecaprenyl-diphosphatase